MNLFGPKKKATPQQPSVTPQSAIQRLNEALESLDKREQFIQKKADREQSEAKRLVKAGNKKAALMALKKKKMYEAQVDKINGTRITIENQKIALESANFNREIFETMSIGARALQGVNQTLSVDRVDETMDDIQEQMDVAREIEDAISAPGQSGLADDADIEAELADLEAEFAESETAHLDSALVGLSAPKTPQRDRSLDLPSAPQVSQSRDKVDEDDEDLRALEAMMAA